MGYVSNDSTLWFNMPGVVAAYQPVRAPGPLDARYNVEHGGSNRYRAEPGVLPTWSAATGWTFASQYLTNGYILQEYDTVIIRLSNGGDTTDRWFGGNVAGAQWNLRINAATTFRVYYGNAYTQCTVTSTAGTNVYGFSKAYGAFLNGLYVGAITGVWSASNTMVCGIGGLGDGSLLLSAALIETFTIYNRPLLPQEMWTASRQIAYCDVNPEWNAWAPRRQWFYYTAPGTLYTSTPSGALASAGALTRRTANNSLAGTTTSAGALTKRPARALAGTLTSAGALTKRMARALAGALASAGVLTKRTARTLTGTLTSSATLAGVRTRLVALAGTLTSAGTLTKRTGKALAGSVSTGGTLIRRTGKALAGALTAAGALVAFQISALRRNLSLHTRSRTLTLEDRDTDLTLKEHEW